MNDWYEYLDNIEDDPAYIEKMQLDNDEESFEPRVLAHRHRKECSWIKNRKYRKRLVRRFLSGNPGLDISQVDGDTARCNDYYLGENKHLVCGINPYTKVYKSCKGDLRVLHGKVIMRGPFVFQLNPRGQIRYIARQTNRRIRHMPIKEDMPNRYSYYKKHIEVWW